jgi:hypothetical protein
VQMSVSRYASLPEITTRGVNISNSVQTQLHSAGQPTRAVRVGAIYNSKGAYPTKNAQSENGDMMIPRLRIIRTEDSVSFLFENMKPEHIEHGIAKLIQGVRFAMRFFRVNIIEE